MTSAAVAVTRAVADVRALSRCMTTCFAKVLECSSAEDVAAVEAEVRVSRAGGGCGCSRRAAAQSDGRGGATQSLDGTAAAANGARKRKRKVDK